MGYSITQPPNRFDHAFLKVHFTGLVFRVSSPVLYLLSVSNVFLSTRTLTPLKAPHPTPGLLKQVSKFISLLPNFLQFTCMFLPHSPRHHFSLTEELPREPTARSAAGSTLRAPQPAASLSLGLEHFRPPSRLYSFI